MNSDKREFQIKYKFIFRISTEYMQASESQNDYLSKTFRNLMHKF